MMMHAPQKASVHITQDPFRLFFPWGLILGITGVSLWPLFFLGGMHLYPSVMHARIMIEGFMAAFVFGFLGTAGPRLVGAKPLRPVELGLLFGLHFLAIGMHLLAFPVAGDLLFLTMVLTFLTVLGRRFLASDELPPPNFVLVGFGFLSAILGVVVLVLSQVIPAVQGWYLLGHHLLNEGFVLMPVLGVGIFLFPRFLGSRPGAGPGALDKYSPVWAAKARIAAITGILILAGFPLEIWVSYPLGTGLRTVAVAAYLFSQAPALFRLHRVSVLGWMVRIGVWLMILGLAAITAFPIYRLAGLHTLVIGGFTVITFTVATRVVLGHSGQDHLFATKLPFLIGTIALIVLSLATRISADFLPVHRNSHLIYASLVWVVAAAIWAGRLVPSLFRPDSV